MSAVLPAGVSASSLARAVDAFAAALGEDAVLTSERELREFRDPYEYRGSDAFDASAVVVPTPSSRSRRWSGSPTSTRAPVDVRPGPQQHLRRARPEGPRLRPREPAADEPGAGGRRRAGHRPGRAGVSFFDLYEHLQAGGHRLWPSIPDLGWGSVVGNALEYGRGYTPYGDHASSVCGMEVVLPGGDVLRTGMGAMTASRCWQAYQHGFGPSPERLFMQSNLGIVTKMGVWLMPEPEVYVSGWARFTDDAAVEPLIDELRAMMLDGTIRNYPLLGRGVGIGRRRAPAATAGACGSRSTAAGPSSRPSTASPRRPCPPSPACGSAAGSTPAASAQPPATTTTGCRAACPAWS